MKQFCYILCKGMTDGFVIDFESEKKHETDDNQTQEILESIYQVGQQ